MTNSDNLDPEQRDAVYAQEPSIAVLAGPGSGKTRTLSFRARHLLTTDPTATALLLTFTNKAAAEMKSRSIGVAKVPSKRLAAWTFHTFCADVLRSHGELVGIPSDFEIMDQRDARALCRTVAAQNSIASEYSAHLFDAWSNARLRQLVPGSDVAAFGKLLQSAKNDQRVADFDDLVVGVATLFSERSDIAAAFSGRFPHILVDEFQDTNAVQSSIVHSLAMNAKTVSIFADDDQAIFGFAGAEAENIQKFITKSKAKTYALTVNYRCASKIVSIANSIIAASKASSGRLMKAHRPGGSVELRKYPDTDNEAKGIADAIASALSKGALPSSIAVLVRSGTRADAIVAALASRNIPVSDWRGETHTPKDRKLIAACLAAVRGSLNARQADALCTLAGIPTCGSTSTIDFLQLIAHLPLSKGLEAMREQAFAGASPRIVVEFARDAIAAQNPEAGASVSDIVSAVGNFEVYDKDFSLEHLLAELALGSLGRAPTEGGGVKVASLHRTKGLQWHTVYLVGLEQGHLPDFRTNTSAQLNEEFRLCFVGVSRAEEQLVITHCDKTRDHSQRPSDFLKLMGL